MNDVIEILSIADEFTTAPGARNIDEGDKSGEEFLEKLLKPAFIRAMDENHKLLIDFDNTEGYATSFLEESFGGLARIYGHDKVLSILEFKSLDEPLLIEEIRKYITDVKF